MFNTRFGGIASNVNRVMTARMEVRQLYDALGVDWTDADEKVWQLNGVTHFRFEPIVTKTGKELLFGKKNR